MNNDLLNNLLKKNKGITLIALVITIIVLLILAGISIAMLSGDNSILGRATDAKEKTERSQIVENTRIDIAGEIVNNKGAGISKEKLKEILSKYFNEQEVEDLEIPEDVSTSTEKITSKKGNYEIALSELYNGKFGAEPWTYDHETQTVKKGNLTLKIGDYVNTTPYTVEGKTFNGKWRVLGEENGQLLLVSANYVSFEGSVTASNLPALKLQGADGYTNGVDKLNEIGARFADGVKTENGRSINVNDLNRITGYDPQNAYLNPTNMDLRGPYSNGTFQYLDEITYRYDGTKVYYKKNSETTESSGTTVSNFCPLGQQSNITAPYKVQQTAYSYFPETLGSFPGTAVSDSVQQAKMTGLSTSSPAYDALFKPQNNLPYWLASSCVDAYSSSLVYWGVFFVVPSATVYYSGLWNSFSGSGSNALGVRPAVSLKSNITPTFVSTDSTTGISTYTI